LLDLSALETGPRGWRAMSGALRKMGVYLGLVEDGERYNARYDDEYDDYDEYSDDVVDGESHETEPVPARDARDLRDNRDSRDPRDARDIRDEQVGTVSKFPDRRGVVPSPEVTELARITTVHPRSYNEARVIGEHFRDGTPVIMNLTEMDHADAKRLVDFAAGLIFCCRGSIERITTKVFLVCPPNVTVAAEEKEKIAADGFYNQS
jgi:cell division inhibitor SepF